MSKKPDDWILNAVEFQRDDGVETIFLRGGIENVVEPKGKGWKRIDGGPDWTTVLERKAPR
jgi:hypothetical protein